MLESSQCTAAIGEVIVEEADDGSTALQALKAAAIPKRRDNLVRAGNWNDEVDANSPEVADVQVDVEEGAAPHRGFDLIFIDYVMTTMSGPEAVQIMRRDMNFTGGIIGVTGNALPSDLTYFKECGADLVITKPLTIQKLMDAVGSVISLKKSNIF